MPDRLKATFGRHRAIGAVARRAHTVDPTITLAPPRQQSEPSAISRDNRIDPGGRILNVPLTARPSGPDEILIARLATGDHEAEVAFVRRFQFRVYGLAHRLVRDKALAEDIAQEAFLRAWRHAPDFDPSRGSVTTWLLTITRNVAIDTLRRRRVEPVDPDLLRSLEPNAEAKSPDELAADNDAAWRLRELIGHLPTEQRRALVLAFFYGQTAHEISISEGIPLGTAKTRIRAAMTKLRVLMVTEKTGQ
jgi:RNA polymerase sigma-70 factor (ECF subfamily)